MALTFYDRSGRPAAYADDGVHIFRFSGQALGYIHKGSLYDYSGRHLGWYRSGWVREHGGRCVLFTERARGGPGRPPKAIRPVKCQTQGTPPKGALQPEPPRPQFSKSWSAVSGDQFFEWFSSMKMGTIPMSWSELRTPKA